MAPEAIPAVHSACSSRREQRAAGVLLQQARLLDGRFIAHRVGTKPRHRFPLLTRGQDLSQERIGSVARPHPRYEASRHKQWKFSPGYFGRGSNLSRQIEQAAQFLRVAHRVT